MTHGRSKPPLHRARWEMGPGNHSGESPECPDCHPPRPHAATHTQVLELTGQVAKQQEQAAKQQRQQEQLKANYVKMQVRTQLPAE